MFLIFDWNVWYKCNDSWGRGVRGFLFEYILNMCKYDIF